MFTIFKTGQVIDPNEMNDNFTHVAVGPPRAGVSLTATTGVYDVGSPAYPWKSFDYDNARITDSIDNCMEVVASYYIDSVNTATARIDFSGLNGDTDELYEIEVNINCTNIGAAFFIQVSYDSSPSYFSLGMYAETAAAISITQAFSQGFIIGANAINTPTNTSVSNGYAILYAKTGRRRLLNGFFGRNNDKNFAGALEKRYELWSNTASTLTSLTFLASTTTALFLTGSSITIYRRTRL